MNKQYQRIKVRGIIQILFAVLHFSNQFVTILQSANSRLRFTLHPKGLLRVLLHFTIPQTRTGRFNFQIHYVVDSFDI